jgi:hypothetical protein
METTETHPACLQPVRTKVQPALLETDSDARKVLEMISIFNFFVKLSSRDWAWGGCVNLYLIEYFKFLPCVGGLHQPPLGPPPGSGDVLEGHLDLRP